MKNEALILALEALEEPKEHIAKHRRLEAITAIKQALEQPEPEPVAWRFRSGTWFNREVHWRYIDTLEGADNLRGLEPLYTSPPKPVKVMGFDCVCGRRMVVESDNGVVASTPKREWQGLTDDEIDHGLLRSDYAFKTAEAWRAGVVFALTKLKEKNHG
jgi:hypothetical protein